MAITDLGVGIKSEFLSSALFNNAWKYVVKHGLTQEVVKEGLMSAFSKSGYLKVIHTKKDYKNIDFDPTIDFEQYFLNILDPTKKLEEGTLGFPVIYSRYSITFSEKMNVISGFNELEYVIATGANPKMAQLSGYILPNNAIRQEYNPIPLVIDSMKARGVEPTAGSAAALLGSDLLLNAPPPDPNPIIDLYQEKMRIYKSIKNESKLYIYGPSGLLIAGQATGMQLDLAAEMSSVMTFRMDMIVSEIVSAKTNVINIPRS